jgi:hypothetical protein
MCYPCKTVGFVIHSICTSLIDWHEVRLGEGNTIKTGAICIAHLLNYLFNSLEIIKTNHSKKLNHIHVHKYMIEFA